MNNFSFSLPTSALYGRGQLENLHKQKLPGKKALIVTTSGKSIRTNGYLGCVEKQLDKANITHALFSQISPNPLLCEITAGAEAAKAANCDFVLGLGGGSAIDAAKAIALMATNPGNYWDYSFAKSGGHKPFTQLPLPIVAIPTTAGTGTEVDAWAVVTNEKTLEKCGGGLPPSTCPVLAIIDPSLTDTVPPRMTAYQGFDALFHATESIINKGENPVGTLFAMKAIELLAKSLPVVVSDGSNTAARDDVALAASLAGYVMLCTSEHSIEHAMSAFHHELPHGAGLIMISRAYYQTFADRHACDEQLIAMAKAMGHIDADSAQDFVNALVDLEARCGVEALSMSDFGITYEELNSYPQLARDAMGGLFFADPAPLTDADILSILQKSYR